MGRGIVYMTTSRTKLTEKELRKAIERAYKLEMKHYQEGIRLIALFRKIFRREP